LKNKMNLEEKKARQAVLAAMTNGWKQKITDLCSENGMHSVGFVTGMTIFAEMLEGHQEPEGIIMLRCEALIKIWADKSEPHWDVLSIVRKIA